MHDKNNIAIGFLVMGCFTLYGFVLISPPALVLVGAIAMTASVVWLGISFYTMRLSPKEAT